MILITGDTHNSYGIGKLKPLKDINLTYEDYLIILGDAGIVWHGNEKDNELLKWYKKHVKCQVLFIDGNHDHHVALNNMEVTQWHGGNIHRINEQVIHLMRGEIYTIEDKTFFTMGGGRSVDKSSRIEGLSWWKEEMPSYDECDYAENNLVKHGNEVDYILTHECPERYLNEVIPYWARIQFGYNPPNLLNTFLEHLYEKVSFKKWFWGHYHVDIVVNDKCRCMYEDIIEIK